MKTWWASQNRFC